MVLVTNNGTHIVNGVVASLSKEAQITLDAIPLQLETESEILARELDGKIIALSPSSHGGLTLHEKVGLHSGRQTDIYGRVEIPMPKEGFIDVRHGEYTLRFYQN